MFGFGGGSSLASACDWKPTRPWDPSQKGLFCEWPQRQSEITVRPARPYSRPSPSQIVNSPSRRKGPLFSAVTFVFAILFLGRFFDFFAERNGGAALELLVILVLHGHANALVHVLEV